MHRKSDRVLDLTAAEVGLPSQPGEQLVGGAGGVGPDQQPATVRGRLPASVSACLQQPRRVSAYLVAREDPRASAGLGHQPERFSWPVIAGLRGWVSDVVEDLVGEDF